MLNDEKADVARIVGMDHAEGDARKKPTLYALAATWEGSELLEAIENTRQVNEEERVEALCEAVSANRIGNVRRLKGASEPGTTPRVLVANNAGKDAVQLALESEASARVVAELLGDGRTLNQWQTDPKWEKSREQARTSASARQGWCEARAAANARAGIGATSVDTWQHDPAGDGKERGWKTRSGRRMGQVNRSLARALEAMGRCDDEGMMRHAGEAGRELADAILTEHGVDSGKEAPSIRLSMRWAPRAKSGHATS